MFCSNKNQIISLYKVCHNTRKRLPPGKSNAKMCNSFVSQEKERKNSHKNVRKTYYWKLIFVICSYSTWASRHIGTKSTQDTLVREHVSTQSTLAHEHVSTQNTLAHEHVSTQGTLASDHASTQGTLTREYVSTQGTLARDHVRHAIQQTRLNLVNRH